MTLLEIISVSVFLIVLFAIYGLELLLISLYAVRRAQGRPGKSVLCTKPAVVLHVVAIAGVLCMLYGYFVEPYWIQTSVVTIQTSKLTGEGLRIVQISDLHCDREPRNEERAAQIVNGLKPDIVVATGDYLNDSAGRARLRDMLGRLEAPLGKFAVTGNCDTEYCPPFDALSAAGFRLLNAETVVVEKGPDQIGISGFAVDRTSGCRDFVEKLPADRFDVLLYHKPDLIEDVRGPGVDLYLCGHTHGGQVALPVYGALMTFSKFGKRYEAGLYRVGGTSLYVNRGLGLEPRPAPQVRFLARPEITVFDIRPRRTAAGAQ
jgi:predicted MPP superfamily phosphohydrolase